MSDERKSIRKFIPRPIKILVRKIKKLILMIKVRLGIIPDRIKVGNYIMFLDLGDTVGYSKQDYEDFTNKVIKDYIHVGDNLIDLGSCLGFFSLNFLNLIGDKGKIYSFEANKNNYNIFSKTIKFNNVENQICHSNLAIIDKIGEDNLFISGDAGSSVMYDEKCGRDSVKVKTTTLDNFFKNFKDKISFIKMDIDGSEARALIGAKNLINKDKPILLVEFSPNRIIHTFGRPSDFLKIIQNYGYKISCINEIDKKIEDGTIENCLRIANLHKTQSDMGEAVNLLCIPNKI